MSNFAVAKLTKTFDCFSNQLRRVETKTENNILYKSWTVYS